MAGVSSEESGVGRSAEGTSRSGEMLVEWRSSEQVENGTPSTSPPYWDSDDDDGSGWSHFAQFTIAVVNKDPKKSKYSDTLHRFWKKEHDWGWKKFMELSKVYDGFIESDTLIIKAQVQVIKEKADRPFRCLDCQYRRELVRVYLTNVEQICRRFLDEKRQMLGKLIEDKARWSSFCAFWLGIDQNARHRMSREKTDVILKVVVKHFFIEKEVTSTLVMDSLYSGLKALEGQSKNKKAKSKLLGAEEIPAPIAYVEKDMFLLVDDVLLLLERAALEPLPPKDEKGPQNRTKDGNSGEDLNKDSIEHDERRLTELGRRTVEIFVLAHIFRSAAGQERNNGNPEKLKRGRLREGWHEEGKKGKSSAGLPGAVGPHSISFGKNVQNRLLTILSNKIEVAYQEAIALKRQEELIREEAAWLAESEQKAKQGASEKEKKSKKKQAKQKRNNRKSKDKGKEKAFVVAQEKHLEGQPDDEKEASMMVEQPVPEKADVLGDISDVSDSVDGATEVIQPDSEDKDYSLVNFETDTSEIHQPTESSGISGLSCVQNEVTDKKSSSMMDDSSSTHLTDSVPSVVMNGPSKGNSFSSNQNKKSPSRGKSQRSKTSSGGNNHITESGNQSSCPALDAEDQNEFIESCKVGESESEAAVPSLSDQTKLVEQATVKKVEEVLPQKKPSIPDAVDIERPKEKMVAKLSSPRSPPRNLLPSAQFRSEYRSTSSVGSIPVRTIDQPASLTTFQMNGTVKSETQKAATSRPTEKPITPQESVMSRPLSALVPGPRPAVPVVSMVQTTPFLARSASADSTLGPYSSEPSAATSYVTQSYRNAMMGNHVASSSSGFTHPISPRSGINTLPAFLLAWLIGISCECTPVDGQFSEKWRRSMHPVPSLISEIQNINLYKSMYNGSRENFSDEFPVGTPGRLTQGVSADEFPHLDIINELLDDEHDVGSTGRAGTGFHALDNGLERTQSYHEDGFQRSFSGSSSNHFDTPREYTPQSNHQPYANGQHDGSVQTQWPMTSSNLSLLQMRNAEGDGYPYYSNPSCGVNGYTTGFRPSNGH
ncbi:MATH domain-containing protein [Hibiscus syriacus]|uniref:MATH domain-containing protein n=1 Tax=Hibiscus syriacus TaxID=106335 RepID=A0A6A3D439_HIBSY|nr:MATH domain-containing protein [Hibiscus syriacus]